MADKIEQFLRSGVGGAIAGQLGLVVPDLERCASGTGLPAGTVVLAGAAAIPAATAALRAEVVGLGLSCVEVSGSDHTAHFPEGSDDKCDALVFDGRGLNSAADLAELHRFFSPMVRRLNHNGRILVIAEPHEDAGSPERAAAQRALEGFTRSVAKEIGNRGSTAQTLILEPGSEAAARSTLAYFLSSRSAYIDGQVVRVRGGIAAPEFSLESPLTDRTVIVTGAARGIGASISRALARRGARIIGVDIPPSAEELRGVMGDIGGESLDADITGEDAPERIAALANELGGVHAVVHNAGVTRDKLLVNMKEQWWDMTLEINLAAAQRITNQLLADGALNDGGRIIGVASMVGISGQRGQTNYAASKAGVIGYVDYMSRDETLLAQGITVNAVAPGFIETQMTEAIPVVTREVARRLNSLSQGGQPEDVAEAIAWLANPGSQAINGVTLRVCGQNWIGA
ncbi:MAG: 3-oxoacyl-ACP reductase [Halioglobus sp.]|nr:3-oxoacyl-ACP reductase [Halioglobus sp.]